MVTRRSLERVAGALMLSFLVTVVLALGLSWAGQPGTSVTDTGIHQGRSPQELVQMVIDNEARLMITITLFLVGSAVSSAMATVIYLLFRPSGQALALLGALGFLMVGVVLLANGTIYLTLWGVAMEFGRSSGATADALAASAYMLVELVRNSWAGALLAFLPLSLGAIGISILRST